MAPRKSTKQATTDEVGGAGRGVAAAVFVALLACALYYVLSVINSVPAAAGLTPQLNRVIQHDPKSFTQGLVISDDVMFESIGLYGESALRRLDLHGNVLQEHKMEKKYFAEGLDLWNGKLVQLTWREKMVFTYDPKTLRQLSAVRQPITVTGEGWGITNNGTHFIVSDGSNWLFFWDPETLQEVGRLQVRNLTMAREFAPLYRRLGPMLRLKPDGDKVHFLNELEFVNGEVLANVWYADKVLRISPLTGDVLGWHDFSELRETARTGKEDCLNGIAYSAQHKQLYITGKLFNKMWVLDMK